MEELFAGLLLLGFMKYVHIQLSVIQCVLRKIKSL